MKSRGSLISHFWSTRRLLLTAIGLVAAEVFARFLYYRISLIPGKILSVFPQRNRPQISVILGHLVVLAVSIALLKSAIQSIKLFLQWTVRTEITNRLLPRLIRGPIAGGDQRVAVDAETIGADLATLLSSLCIVPFEMVFYTVRLSVLGYHSVSIITVYGVFLIIFMSSHWMTTKYADAVKGRQQAEGFFRSSLAITDAFSETVAMSGTGEQTHRMLDFCYAQIQTAYTSESFRRILLTLISEGSAYFGTFIAYGLIAVNLLYGPPQQLSEIPAQVATSSFMLLYLINLLGSFVAAAATIGDARASYFRLSEMYNAPDEHRDTVKADALSLTNVTIEGLERVFIRNLTICIDRSTLITGPNGVGKSTLVKVFCGQHAPSSGLVTTCAGVVIIPQQLVMLAPSLRDFFDGHPHLEEVIKTCQLERIFKRIPFDRAFHTHEWSKMLSPGELQCLYLARMLLLRPRVVILDESTNAVERGLEGRILSSLHSTGVIIVMVAQHADFPFFHQHLHLSPSSQWSLTLLPTCSDR